MARKTKVAASPREMSQFITLMLLDPQSRSQLDRRKRHHVSDGENSVSIPEVVNKGPSANPERRNGDDIVGAADVVPEASVHLPFTSRRPSLRRFRPITPPQSIAIFHNKHAASMNRLLSVANRVRGVPVAAIRGGREGWTLYSRV